MQKLSEKRDDEYLSDAEQAEEKLGSVDYDVWKCKACSSHESWFFINSSTVYSPCPRCKAIAYEITSTRTLKEATYSESGKREDIHTCKFCGHRKTSTHTISQRVPSSSSGGTSSGSGSFGSSSSGSSWGGGRSGGGGASSSW